MTDSDALIRLLGELCRWVQKSWTVAESAPQVERDAMFPLGQNVRVGMEDSLTGCRPGVELKPE